ncbi:MAG: tetratricopeptide repeat protein [Alphaproteobacteria bacterium GM202ARS2]|nr:tetratricopeptide repeat protein [Alphaproteobacteria bacterium GM202ARS2]
MLAILKEQQAPPEQLESKLKEIAERHLELTEKLHALSNSNDEPEITKQREQAAEAIEQGDYDKAAGFLEQAVSIDRQAINEQQDALDRRKLSAAATIVQQGELERTRLNYRKAAEHFAEAASLVPMSEADTRFDYLMKQSSALYAQGDEFGDNQALVEAIDALRLILEERIRERAPLDWALTKDNLGNALCTLGERESGTDRLEQAVAAYKAALEERTRERVPLDWAMTQNNLGCALIDLGERKKGTAKFKQAIVACKAALEERTRKRVPLDWAMTQNNLGLALWRLGEHESGTERLKQAVAAYEAALGERTRKRVPLDWAQTQENLGLALWSLAEKSQNQAILLMGIEALRASAEVFTKWRSTDALQTAKQNLAGAKALLIEMKGRCSSR